MHNEQRSVLNDFAHVIPFNASQQPPKVGIILSGLIGLYR